MKKFLLLILAVLALPAVAPNESKAQGFSITFGGAPGYYGSGYYNGGYCNPGDGYYYYHRRVYYGPGYYPSYYYGGDYRRHHRYHRWHDDD